MGSDTPVLVLCNSASLPNENISEKGSIVLNYLGREDVLTNVKLGLPELCPRCVPLAGSNTRPA